MDSNNLGVRKKVNWMLIGVITASSFAALFLILFIIQIVKNNEVSDELSKVKTELATYQAKEEEVAKKVLKGNTTKKTIEIEEQGVAKKEDGTVTVKDSVKYLEPKEWDIKFKYPEGVTDIAYGVNAENFDGALYITGIAKGSKIYDVNICGGKDAYNQYPFFLGEMDRWNPSGAHDEWESSPSVYDGMKRLLKTSNFEYYVNTHYGNGCETGEDNEDYIEATKLAKEILESVEKKEVKETKKSE